MGKYSGSVACAVAAFSLVVCSGCAKAPDLDAELEGAIPLELGVWHRDALDCAGQGDCRDWFRVEVPAQGSVRVDVARRAQVEDAPDFVLEVADASGRPLATATSAGRERLSLGAQTPSGPVHVATSVIDLRSGLLSYELRVSFRPAPRARPKPRFDTVRSVVLEIEKRPDGARAVLIDKGRRAGIAPGNRGRLLESGREIAKIEILDVYDDGSRALIRGALAAPITPETVAEVQVPR